MNLFSRLSEILDEVDEWKDYSILSSRRQIERLLLSMERNFERAQRSAVRLITAERAVARELSRQVHGEHPSQILVNRLREEHTCAAIIKCSVKQTLREMREGLEQSRRFRDTVLRWRNFERGSGQNSWRRLFWHAYHRLCDLADGRLGRLAKQSAPVEKKG